MRYIFVHIPKTAGTSLYQAIVQQFGTHNVLAHYGAPPESQGWWQGATAQIRTQLWPQRYVVGHIPVTTYLDAQGEGQYCKRANHRYVTFLRHPLERALSHYYYWKQIDDPQNPRWRTFHEEQWTVEQFLVHPQFVNFHLRYTRGLTLEQFDFVGVVDAYAQSMHLLGCLFPEFRQLPILQSRQNVHKDANAIAKLSPQVIDEFTRLHHVDMAMYEYARQRVMRLSDEYANHRA